MEFIWDGIQRFLPLKYVFCHMNNGMAGFRYFQHGLFIFLLPLCLLHGELSFIHCQGYMAMRAKDLLSEIFVVKQGKLEPPVQFFCDVEQGCLTLGHNLENNKARKALAGVDLYLMEAPERRFFANNRG